MISLKQFTASDGSSAWFDVLLEDGDLATDSGLEAAVVLSLFLDRRAEPDDVTDDDNKRGWWADGLDGDGDLIGSRLWLLNRAKTVADVPGKAEEYADEALAWMVEDQVAKSVQTSAQRVGDTTLQLNVVITRQSGGRWEKTWEVRINAL